MSCCNGGCGDPARSRTMGFVLLIMVLGLVGFQVFSKQKAPTPAAFREGVTLNDAVWASAVDGKVVLVVAHADWCGPCQRLKRGALSDAEVTRWVEANTHPVSLDVTRMDDSTPEWVKQAADSLGISGIPAMVLVRDGKVVSRRVGSMNASALMSWLTTEGTPALKTPS